jgi:hypothetical protein
MTSGELRDYATVLAASVALLVFVLNVLSQSRSRRIENIARFNHVHQRLLAHHSYLGCNLAAIAAGTMRRDRNEPEYDRNR